MALLCLSKIFTIRYRAEAADAVKIVADVQMLYARIKKRINKVFRLDFEQRLFSYENNLCFYLLWSDCRFVQSYKNNAFSLIDINFGNRVL